MPRYNDIHSSKYRDYSVYVPSPPSRMPSVEDPRSLGISSRSGLPHRLALGSNIEGSGFLDVITKVGTKLGDPFKKQVGVNPFTMGFDLGEKVIAPALMKVIPPKRGRGVGMLGGQKGIRTM
jgi:hypothetical protein